MAWESGGRANLVNPGDNYKNSPNAPHSIGIGQWNDRSQALIAHARSQGINVPNGNLRDVNYARSAINAIPLETQLSFANSEMQGSERRAYGRIASAPDLRSANAGAIGYHRPAGYTWANPEGGHGFDGRLALAQRALQTGGSSASSAGSNFTAPQQPAVGTGASGARAASEMQDGITGASASRGYTQGPGIGTPAAGARAASELQDGTSGTTPYMTAPKPDMDGNAFADKKKEPDAPLYMLPDAPVMMGMPQIGRRRYG
jgi:hypothetical protein